MPSLIKDLEIFAAGTHHAMSGEVTVTEEDLDKIVDAFTSLDGTNIVRPHLKLGHTDAQKWFGQKDGIPSLGWITRVWRQGRKLLADINDVPDALLDMIKSKRYHNVSVEVLWGAGVEHNGRKFDRVLTAVALLGVEMPAVKDLAGLAGALFKAGPIHQFSAGEAIAIEATTEKDVPMPPDDKTDKGAPAAIYSHEQHTALVEAAVAKAVSEAEVKFAATTESSKKELEVAVERAKQAEAEITKVKAEATAREATTLVDTAIKDGKLLPKQRDFALAALSAIDVKVKFGEKGEEKSMPEIFKDFLGAQGKVIDTSEKGDGSNKQVTYSTAAEEVDAKTKSFMAEKQGDKPDYALALDAVLAADSELRDRYAGSQV